MGFSEFEIFFCLDLWNFSPSDLVLLPVIPVVDEVDVASVSVSTVSTVRLDIRRGSLKRSDRRRHLAEVHVGRRRRKPRGGAGGTVRRRRSGTRRRRRRFR